MRKFDLAFSIRNCSVKVECLISMLDHLVILSFGELHCVFTKLLVVVSVYCQATLQRIIRPWFDLHKRCKSKHLENDGFGLIDMKDANQTIPQWTLFGKLLGHVM